MQDNSAKSDSEALTPDVLSPVMSEHAFALWGADDVAYIKHVTAQNGESAWVIFSADGTSLAAQPERDLAFATATQNDRLALSVH